LPPIEKPPPIPIDDARPRLAEQGFASGDTPNDFLREQAQGLPPGEALCLAKLGYSATVQDISPVD
jgi:hypothetical protein